MVAKKRRGRRSEEDDDDDEPEQSRSRKKSRRKAAGQPPPPVLKSGSKSLPWSHDHHHGDDDDDDDDHRHHYHLDHKAVEVIYSQLLEVRKTVDDLVEETKASKLRKRLDHVPVRTSDLMRGFQAAVAKANRSVRSGEEEGEDIERMSIKDLQISLSAPIIDGGHAEDPVLMLPNIKSADAESSSISMKFTVVSVPIKQRG